MRIFCVVLYEFEEKPGLEDIEIYLGRREMLRKVYNLFLKNGGIKYFFLDSELFFDIPGYFGENI